MDGTDLPMGRRGRADGGWDGWMLRTERALVSSHPKPPTDALYQSPGAFPWLLGIGGCLGLFRFPPRMVLADPAPQVAVGALGRLLLVGFSGPNACREPWEPSCDCHPVY